jgi:multiple sugar transport system permease protein
MAALAPARRKSVFTDRRARDEAITAYLFISPYLLVTLVFTVGVILFAISISFTKFDLYTTPQWVGIQNYIDEFKGGQFVRSLVNTLWYVAIVVPAQTSLALLLAVILNVKVRGTQIFRTIFYAPSVTSSVAISLIFWWLYLKTGFLNYFLAQILGPVGFKPVDWLDDARGLFQIIAQAFGGNIPSSLWYLRGPSVTWMAIMFQNIFTTAPTFMIMFLAALQDIPPSLYEAASIDGATSRQQFWAITVPMLRPVILLVVVLGTIGTWLVFDQVAILTAGGPLDTTLTPVYLIYTEAIGKSGTPNAGFASAMAFTLSIIIFLFTVVQRRFIERGTESY